MFSYLFLIKLLLLAGVPVEGESSVCLICTKYSIILAEQQPCRHLVINLQYSVAFISSRCVLHRLRRSIRFPSIFGFLMIFCRKTQRTNAKSGRPKVADWKVAVKKIYGTFGVEMRAYGQKLVKFCTHTRSHRYRFQNIAAL